MTSLRILLLFLTFLSVIILTNCQDNEEEEEYNSDEDEGEEEEEEFPEELKKLLDIFGSAVNETRRPHLNCSSEAAIEIEKCAIEFANTFAFKENDVTEEDLCRIGGNFLDCFDNGFRWCNSVNVLAARTKYRQDVKDAVQPDEGDCKKFLKPSSTTTPTLLKIRTTLHPSTEIHVTPGMTHTSNLNNSRKTGNTLKPEKPASRAGQLIARNEITLSISILPIISFALTLINFYLLNSCFSIFN